LRLPSLFLPADQVNALLEVFNMFLHFASIQLFLVTSLTWCFQAKMILEIPERTNEEHYPSNLANI
jgi:hypothetical protein